MKTKQWIIEIIVFLLAGLFLYTAVSKLMDFDKFIWQINNQPFDNRLTPFLTHFLPVAELLLTGLLLWPKTRMAGLYGSGLLLTVFTVYIALVTFNFYPRVPCGCAAAFEHLSWPQHLIMNASFTVMAFTAIYLTKKHSLRA